MNTREGSKLLKPEVVADLCGHGAIESYYPELKGKGENKECTDFSNPDNFPKEIVEAIKQGRMTRFGISKQLLTQPALAEYEKVKQPALAEYEKVKQPALAEYEKVEQLAWAEYQKVEQLAWAEYEKVAQSAFWKLFADTKNRNPKWR